MSNSNNIYNILGKLDALRPQPETVKQTAQKIYESVEAQGSVLEGVNTVESKLNEKYLGFKKHSMSKDTCNECGMTMESCNCDQVDEDRETVKTEKGTIYKGKYGTEYQGDSDEEEASDKAPKKRGRPAKGTKKVVKKNAPGVKGRPKKEKEPFTGKDATDAAKRLGNVFGAGKPPKSNIKGRIHKMDETLNALYKSLSESRIHETSEYTYETIGRRLAEENPNFDLNSDAFFHAVYDEMIEIGMSPRAARNKLNYDEDFLSDTASAYSHFCKHIDEAVRPEDIPAFQRKAAGSDFPVTVKQVNAPGDNISDIRNIRTNTGRNPETGVPNFRDTTAELNELAKLAGLTTQPAMEAKTYGDTEVEEAPTYSNTPDEEVESVDTIIHQGNDLNKEKKQFAGKPKLGDNPMAKESFNPLEALGNKLMAKYESIKIQK